MLKRKEFILGAAAGLALAAGATAGGVMQWPQAQAQVAGASGRLTPDAGNGAAFAPPMGAPRSFADIFDQVSPAVVQINVESQVAASRGNRGQFQIPGLPGFGFSIPQEEGAEPRTQRGAGSGFFISGDGFIVTNNHVVADATSIQVTLSDGRELDGEVVGRDPETDLAVVKVEGRDFPFVEFEQQAQPRVGDWVIAVGNPFSLGGTATAGIVSAVGRAGIDPGPNRGFVDFLQIDAAINTGNSGGPTFDTYGRVIGVNSAIYSQTGGSVGIGFAVPSSVAQPVVQQLIADGSVQRGYLGASISALDAETVASLGLREGTEGALVEDLTAGAPGAEAGLRIGDVVTSLNGQAIEDGTALTRGVSAVRPGQPLRMEILRDGRRQTITARAGTRPANLGAADTAGSGTVPTPRGTQGEEVTSIDITVTPIPASLRERFNLPGETGGVLISGVTAGSAAARANVAQGLVIERVNYTPIATPRDFAEAVEQARRAGRPSVLLSVRTPTGQAGRLNVPLGSD